MAKKEIRFNAFEMNCVVHQASGLWRIPGDQAWKYKDIEYWQNIAQIAERGIFDAIFIADVLGKYDLYDGNDLAAIRRGTQIPVNDPLQIAIAGAAVTKNISFGVTTGVFFEHPFPFARRLSTIDHLTKGRVGWNIVTGYLPSANRQFGEKEWDHDERYNYADEYLEVIYKLLEGSWEDDAVIRDPESGVFTIPEKVHHIGHHGKYFTVPDTHISEPSPQRTPLLFQAGSSARGRQFAAKHAEAIFICPPTKEYAKLEVARIREELEKAGRNPYDAKIFALSTVITAETDELAKEKWDYLTSFVDLESAAVLNSGWLGVDFAKLDLDAPLPDGLISNAILSGIEAFQTSTKNDGKKFTVRDIIQYVGIGGQGQKWIGSPTTIADTLEEIIDYTDLDGFNLTYAQTPNTLEDIVNLVVPELQRRGRYPTAYKEGTLRNKLFGKGDRLPENHIGSKYRVGGELSTIDDYSQSGRPKP